MNPTLPANRFPSVQTRLVKLTSRHRWLMATINHVHSSCITCLLVYREEAAHGCPPGGQCLGNGIPRRRVLPVRRTTGQHLTAPNISSLHQDLLEELFRQRSLVTFLLPVLPRVLPRGGAERDYRSYSRNVHLSHTITRHNNLIPPFFTTLHRNTSSQFANPKHVLILITFSDANRMNRK